MLFDDVLAAGPVRDAVSDEAWLRAMLAAEAALAGASADAGVIPAAAAEAIAAACEPSRFDLESLGRSAAAAGNPAAPLARALTAAAGDAGRYVHFGATSQDIVDTAAMLVARAAREALLADLSACLATLAGLAAAHRSTIHTGRTLLQQALPTTFGLVAAGWLTALSASAAALRSVSLPAQLGGAVGTLASLGADGPAVVSAYARRLGLAEPALPWHTDRGVVAELAGALGRVCGSVAKIAGDVVLLAQTEVGEVSESDPGGSSTMPHKQNPIAAISAIAAARQAPGLVSTLFGAMPQEHQRAAGAWHAEWRPQRELLRATGSAVWWLRTSLSRLVVDAARMRSNVDLTGGALLAERVTTALTSTVGRQAAHDAVASCVRAGGDLAAALAEHPALGLSRAEAESLLDPSDYLGAAEVFVDRALSHHARQ